MIRLIASDLDGTLLDHNGKLPAGTFEVIEELRKRGIYFAASSGRQYGNLVRLFAPASKHMAFVCENGAYCVFEGKDAATIAIPEHMVGEILAELKERDMNPLISGKHTCYMFDNNRKYTDDIIYRLRNTVTIISSVDEIAEPILKISGQIDSGVALLASDLVSKWDGRLTATVSGHDWFDFTLANKGIGIQKLMEFMGLRKEEVAAFGDNFNDETMLDFVDHPFLMSNAHPALHKSNYHKCESVLPVFRAIAEADGDIEKALEMING